MILLNYHPTEKFQLNSFIIKINKINFCYLAVKNKSHLSDFSNHETYITCTCIIYIDHNHAMLNNKNYFYLTFQEVGFTKYCYD